MRLGFLLVGATFLLGASCVYDLDPYQSTQGSGGASTTTSTSTSSITTTTTTSSTSTSTSTSTQSSSSSGVGGGLPTGLDHCQREGVATADEDAFDTGQSCNTTKYLWRPGDPYSIDDSCPPSAGDVTMTKPAGGVSKFIGALGQYMAATPRKRLVFKDCYVSLAIGDVAQLQSGVFAYAGLASATDSGDPSHITLRAAHTGPTSYGVYVDASRTGRVGTSVTDSVGKVDDYVRFGESNGEFFIETKSAAQADWTAIYKVQYEEPTEGDLTFAFGVFVKSVQNGGTAHFDDYNIE